MRIRRIVRAKRKQIIFSKSIKIIIVFLKKKKFIIKSWFSFFESQIKDVYFYFINVEFNFVNVRNNNVSLFIISHYYKIDLIMKYEVEKVYFVNLTNHFLVAKSF